MSAPDRPERRPQWFRTVEDMQALPFEKIEPFITDLMLWLQMIKLADVSGELRVTTPRDAFGWLDDGKHDVHVTLTLPDGTSLSDEQLQSELGDVAVPARAHQEETKEENDDDVSRVDGKCFSERQELPRSSPTGDPRRCDELLKNLRGSCAFGGTCGTTRARGEFCTMCEAAARLEEAGWR